MKKSILTFVCSLLVIALLGFTVWHGVDLGFTQIPSITDTENGVRLGLDLVGGSIITFEMVDPMPFLKQLRRDKENSHKVLDYVSEHLIEYARLMIDNGASVISIADPTATGEILGPKMFEEYAVTYL